MALNNKPFTCTGVDYFGPLLVKVDRSRVKRYECLFACMATRAVHLDIVGSLVLARSYKHSSDSPIAVL